MTRDIAATLTSARIIGSSSSDNWQSPSNVLDRVRRLAPIGLDPCTTKDNPVGAHHLFYLPTWDGLAERWGGLGLVYVNFPYSEAVHWTRKIVEEAERGVEIATLCPARPDSRWFFRLVWNSAQAICFWKGRLRFVGAPSSAPFPSAVVYHGHRPSAFEGAFRDAGRVVRL